MWRSALPGQALRLAAPAVPDEYGMGPFVTVPADGVSDDLLRRYVRVWAPEEGDSR